MAVPLTPDFLPPGTPVDLDNCDREPIHLPGAVQPFGALLVARRDDHTIVQASANARDVLGEAAVGATLDALLGADVVAELLERTTWAAPPAVHPLRIDRGGPLDAGAYLSGDRLVVEVEPAAPDKHDADTQRILLARTAGALQASESAGTLLQTAARAVRELTGFDRVWAYRFEPDDHGVVVAEERADHLESFFGLHYPASDIPVQARALFLRNGVRVIPDVEGARVALDPALDPETGAWIDLSGGTLRAVSPMHVRYLQNMGVRASLSIALTVDGRLWGLLSAHHYAGARLVGAATRASCELIAIMTALQIAAKQELEQARRGLELERAVARLLDAVAIAPTLIDGVTADGEALLRVCGAAGAIVAVAGRVERIGQAPDAAGAQRLIDALAEHDGGDVIALDHAAGALPGTEDLAPWAAGVLALPLSRDHGSWLIWVRPEQEREVAWAHRDKEVVQRDAAGTLGLGPRESFERWAETVRGRSRGWEPAALEAASALRSGLGTLLLARADELARLNAQLARSNDELDTFAYAAAHDLQEPLRGIHNYASFLQEDYGDVLDDEGRERLRTIMRLVQRSSALIASLLDYARVGGMDLRLEELALADVVDDVCELLHGRLLERDARIEVTDARVYADRDRLSELLANLVSNAVKYTPGDAPVVEIGVCPLPEAPHLPDRLVRALEAGQAPADVCFVRDRGIGIAPEHHELVFGFFRRLHPKDAYGGGSGAGLTLVRRLVDRHGGCIWIDSEPGTGTTMFFTLEAR